MEAKQKAETNAAAAAQASHLQTQEPAVKRLRVEVAPKCSCGVDSVRTTVKKEGAHFGRPFFKCSKQSGEGCTFFVWEELLQTQDGLEALQAQQTDGKEILCRCGVASVQFTVKKEGPNMGRAFRRCAED